MSSTNPGVQTGSSSISRGRGNKTDKTRRVWSKSEDDVLIACLKELVAQGWKGDNGFRPGYLAKLEDGMQRAFPGTDLKGMPHINSKICTWKKHYGSLTTMLRRSGVGFNVKGTHMIDCNNELWDLVVKNDSNARLMRYKSFPYLEDWKEIFGKDRATGERAEDVMEAVNEMMSEDDLAQAGADGEHNVNLDEILGDDDEENSVCLGDKGKSAVRSTGKKRKNADGLEGVYDLLGQLCRNTDARLENIAGRIGYEFDLGKAKNSVFDLLGNIPGLSLEDKFDVCELLAEKVERLEIFMGLSLEDKFDVCVFWCVGARVLTD